MKTRSIPWSAMVSLIIMMAVPTKSSTQPTENGFTRSIASTHALIVGISDYRYIEDLQFADRDAMVFKEYLVRTLDCQSDTNNIVILLNDAAVSPAVYKALEDLVALVDEGDKVYIYFSGHGDSENTTIFQSGFLLTYDTPPNSYYTNSLNVSILNHFIHTLSTKNKADVTFIADACRAGKLGNQTIKGVAQTARALAENVADEIRILSCQPDEISLEGVQWGNGRGLFSFHLVNALYGLADTDPSADGKISLNELNIYLSTHVPRDAQPVNQYPGIYGPMNKIIGLVHREQLATLKENTRVKAATTCRDAFCKSYEARFLAELDTLQQEYYRAFNRAINSRNLQSPKNKNALYYLDQLKESAIDDALANLLKRKLVVALQEESLLFMDQLSDLNTRWHYKDMKYGKWARDLQLSAALMGEDHYLYKTTMGKYYFFNAAYLYSRSQQGNPHRHPEDLLRESLEMINQAIRMDHLVTYYYNLQGVLVNKLNYPQQAIRIFDEAIRLSPEYPYPYANKSWALIKTGQYQKAIDHCDVSIKLDPGFTNAYQYKITALKKLGKQDEAMVVFRELMRISHYNVGL